MGSVGQWFDGGGMGTAATGWAWSSLRLDESHIQWMLCQKQGVDGSVATYSFTAVPAAAADPAAGLWLVTSPMSLQVVSTT
jgi:hypothetical protein